MAVHVDIKLLILLSGLFSHITPHTDSAKILHIYHMGCRSTVSMHQTISKILLSEGHEIIAISPLPMLEENLSNYIDLNAHDDFEKFIDEYTLEDNLSGTFANRRIVYVNHVPGCENLYRDTEVAKKLKNIKPDLVLLEIDSAECFLPFAAQFQVPIIGLTTGYFLFPDFDGAMGNPVNPSYVPIPFSGLGKEMGFFQRVLNTKDYLSHLAISWYYTNEADALVGKYLKSPPSRELYDRIALVFCNSHFSFLAKPTAPSTVDIGGIHIEDPKPLPKDIQKFIDSSPEGVVYLSLGSLVKFSGLSKSIHDTFTNVLKKLPHRVIWRHDQPEMIPSSAKNILVRKWFPQKDILAHPKVILFISHCGMYSTFEAINSQVPMLTFPILYDQFTNAALVQSLEIGIPLNSDTLNENSLKSAIDEIVQNKKYRENVEKLSAIFKDRPLGPRETLIYWVNYVLRHKDVSYLKPAGVKLPFYQYLLLDVILFLMVMLILVFCIGYVTLKLIVWYSKVYSMADR